MASVNEALAGLGLEPDRVDVLHPLGPAISVTIAVPGGSAAGDEIDPVISALNDKPNRYEGVFIELVAPDGSPLIASGSALRAGTDTSWISGSVPGDNGMAPSPPASASPSS
ncbi:MAG: hypothetical protein ACR2K3_01915 [Nocardioides sp.]